MRIGELHLLIIKSSLLCFWLFEDYFRIWSPDRFQIISDSLRTHSAIQQPHTSDYFCFFNFAKAISARDSCQETLFKAFEEIGSTRNFLARRGSLGQRFLARDFYKRLKERTPKMLRVVFVESTPSVSLLSFFTFFFSFFSLNFHALYLSLLDCFLNGWKDNRTLFGTTASGLRWISWTLHVHLAYGRLFRLKLRIWIASLTETFSKQPVKRQLVPYLLSRRRQHLDTVRATCTSHKAVS